MTYSIMTHSPEETEALGRRLGAAAFPGTVMALWGDLGAGKTALTRGIARGMGITHPVASPTFTIVHQMPGPMTLYHMDLYRLADADEVAQAGLEDMWYADGVSVIEWPVRAEDILPESRMDITLEHGEGDDRHITLEAHGPEYDALLEDIHENSGH